MSTEAAAPDAHPLVTIAIPTYNRARSYLREALESALAQQYPCVEVIVSDNASSDDTPAQMRRCRDPRLRYLRHEVNIGSTANYNYCLQQARGDYFLLLHDDDRIDGDFVACCMAAAEYCRDAAMIRTGVRIIDGRGAVLRQTTNPVSGSSTAEFFCAWFAGETAWYCANTVFNTAQLRGAGGFSSPFRLAEDGFAIARLAHGKRVDVGEVKASFRVHSGEQTFAAPRRAAQWGREYLALLDTMCASLPTDQRERVARAGRRFFARRCYDRAATVSNSVQRAQSYWEVFRLFGCRQLPTHRWRTWRFATRAAKFAQRRLVGIDSQAFKPFNR